MRICTIVASLIIPLTGQADTITAHLFQDFEGGTEGQVVTASILIAGSHGAATGNGWDTWNLPNDLTSAAIPTATITTNAGFPLYTPIVVDGVTYSSAGTKGMRVNVSTLGAIALTWNSPGFPSSFGFNFRWNGANINNSPRDLAGFRSDPSGGFQILQVYDGATPYFHTHYQPPYTMVGNNISFQKSHWYWVTGNHVRANQTFSISYYDAENGYNLVGTSTGTIQSTAQDATTFYLGMINYNFAGTQTIDYDNLIINTNGTFPLGPGTGPSVTNGIPWSTNIAGIPGGIPVRSTIYTNFSSGATLAQIQAGVNSCPSNQVVKLGAGTYTWGAGQNLDMAPYVTLRGAGMRSTIIKSSAGSATHGEVGGITIAADVYSGTSSNIDIYSGAVQGSTNLVLANANTSTLHVGYTIVVNQTNDGTFVYNGTNTPGGSLRTDITPEGDGLRCMNQRVMVTALSGTNVTIWPPLYWTFTNNPHIYWYRSSSSTRNNIEYAGVEDLTVENTAAEGTCIGLNRAAYCWVTNVCTTNAAVYHIGTYRAYRCDIVRNWCDTSLDYTSSHGYVIVMEYQTSGCRIEDNIIVNQRQFVTCNSGSSGNVVLYNYMTNAVPTPGFGFMVHSGGSHSAHPIMNLFEGNIGYKLNFDFYWGSGGPNTVFRNWLGRNSSYANQVGSALVIDATNSFNTVLGNVLGYSGINGNTNWTTRSRIKISPAAMAYDNVWASIRFGYYSDSDVGSGANSTNQWTNTIVGGNYDYVTATNVWDNPTSPVTLSNSLFYTSKPAYFGSAPWPPIEATNVSSLAETNIPAGYRYAFGVDPTGGVGGGGAAMRVQNLRIRR